MLVKRFSKLITNSIPKKPTYRQKSPFRKADTYKKLKKKKR